MAPPPAIEVDSVGKRYWLGTGHHEDSLGRKVDRLVKTPVSQGVRGRDAHGVQRGSRRSSGRSATSRSSFPGVTSSA